MNRRLPVSSKPPATSNRRWRRSTPARWLAENPRHLISRSLRRISDGLLDALANSNSNAETNGEYALIRRLRSDLNQVVDVGAFIGDWSACVSATVPGAHILAVEPTTSTFSVLKRRFEAEQRVVVEHAALGAASSRMALNTYEQRPSVNSLLPFKHAAPAAAEVVDVTNGDDLCDRLGVAHIDLLKIDVEGYELDVLQGFIHLINDHNVDVIQFEYGFAYIEAGHSLSDCYQLLQSRGYTIGKLRPNGVDFSPYEYAFEDYRVANYVAVSPLRQDIVRRISLLP